MSTPGNVALLALLAALAAPAAQDAQSTGATPVRLVDGDSMVELHLDRVSVADFLAAAQPILVVPIQSLPDEVVPARLHQSGVQRVPLAQFRDEFDAVLRRDGFWSWDDPSGVAPVIVVRKELAGRFLGRIPYTAPVITLEELAAGPRLRGPLYTTTFPLTHLFARNQLISLMPFLDTANEIAMVVEGSNQLQITASREHLLAIRDALAQIDVPGPDAPGVEVQLTALKQNMLDFETRLSALEEKAGG